MSDPKRLLSGSANDLAHDLASELGRDLLRSAELLDVASTDGKSRAYGLVGALAVGGGATGGAGASASSSAGASGAAKIGTGVASASIAPKAASVGAVVFLKWLAVPVVIGAVAAGTHLSKTAAMSPQVASTQITSPQIASAPSTATVQLIADLATPTPAISAAPLATQTPLATPALRVTPSVPTSHSHTRTTISRSPQTLSINGISALTVNAGSTSTNVAAPNAAGTNPDATNVPATTPPISASQLSEETASLDRIGELVRTGRSADALRALDQYDARFAGRGLVQESTIVRIKALLANGDRAAAASSARQFLADYPTSSHADAVRALLARASSSP